VHRPVEHHGRAEPGQSQSAGEGRRFPVPMRYGAAAALAARGSSVKARDLRGRAVRSLCDLTINEDETLRVEISLRVEPCLPPPPDVRTVLFGGVRVLRGNQLRCFLVPRTF